MEASPSMAALLLELAKRVIVSRGGVVRTADAGVGPAAGPAAGASFDRMSQKVILESKMSVNI